MEKIKEDFKKVISYSQNIPDPEVDEYFDIWKQNKDKYIKLFGNKLIWESEEEVTFYLSFADKEKKFYDFIENVISVYNSPGIATFLNQITVEEFFNNSLYQRSYYDINNYDGKEIKAGHKVIRAFKYFENNENVLKKVQEKASMLIQDNCVCGKVCFSVHPLDYLSISENASNWTTCHTLDGEYRAGNLAYMLDSSTVICYIKSTKNAILPHFPEDVPWNNKKWRVLLFFDNYMEMMFAGRQYPFESLAGLSTIKSYMFKAGLGYWSKWANGYLTKFKDGDNTAMYFNDCIPIGHSLIPMRDLFINNSSPFAELFYNDLTRSNVYTKPYYSYNITESNPFSYTGWTDYNKTKFDIGNRVCCAKCGKHYITNSSKMICETCESLEDQYFICDICEQIHDPSEAYLVEDKLICINCYNKNTETCGRCGDRVFKNHITYHLKHGCYVCKNCEEEIKSDGKRLDC